jgi:hypothetical protein
VCRLTVLSGDPNASGPYAIEIRSAAAHADCRAIAIANNRTANVVSGEWHFGYGEEASEAATTTLGPGGFYTEPASVAHFAFTGDAPAVVYITGQGRPIPKYVNPADDPSHASRSGRLTHIHRNRHLCARPASAFAACRSTRTLSRLEAASAAPPRPPPRDSATQFEITDLLTTNY